MKRDQRAARDIAWLLTTYRIDHGLSQREFAERVATSYSPISRIESGRQATSLDTLLRIAHALDMKVILGFERLTSTGETERDLLALERVRRHEHSTTTVRYFSSLWPSCPKERSASR